MACIKRILFAGTLLLLLVCLIIGVRSESGRLTLISGDEAAALTDSAVHLTDDTGSMEFGTLTIEGVKAPYAFDEACYYLPQSMKTETLDGLISWSDRAKNVYLVADALDKPDAIATGQKLTLLIVGKDGYFYRDLVLTGLPIVTLDTDDASNRLYGDERGRGAVVRIYDPMGSENGGYDVFLSGVRYQSRGGSTQTYEKRQYKLSFLSNGGKSRSAAVLGLEKSTAILMSAQECEESRFRDALCKSLWNELCAGSPARFDFCTPNSQFAEMLMNGTYIGLYSFFEKTPVDVNGFKDSDVLAKVRWVSAADREAYLAQYGDGPLYKSLYFPLIQGDASRLPAVKDYVVAAENQQFIPTDAGTVFYATNAIDYALFINAVSGVDNIHGNYFLYGTAGRTPSPFARIPWDLDRTFGKPFGEEIQIDPALAELVLITPELKALISERGAWDRVCARWRELRESVLQSEHINAQMAEHAQLLETSGAYARENARWTNGADEELYRALADYSDRHLAFLDEVFSEPDPARFLLLTTEN